MKINISNIGPAGVFDRKSDIIFGLYHSLVSLGHQVTIGSNKFEIGCVNLVIGSDIIAGSPKAVDHLISNKIEYIVYEVENFNGRTVNYRTHFNLDNYHRFLRHANYIITPYIYNLPALTRVVGKANVKYCRWGFHPKMINNEFSKSKDPDYQALFFGMTKGSRVEKIRKLSMKLGKKFRTLNESDPFTSRAYFISNCKWGLSLSYGETDDFVNPFRLFCMIANGLPVLADHKIDEDGYLEICITHSFEDLIEKISEEPDHSGSVSEKLYKNRLEENLRFAF
jgi:hypothetical protein